MATQTWEKGSKNEVVIDGILSEVKLQEGTDKNGNPAIYGEYKIKTTNVIDGIEYKAITNIGYNPTVGGNDNIIIETHILEFNGDIYSKTIKLKFVDYLRPEYKFESIEELKKQLERDKMFVMHQ